jgi:2-methylcitrate dehydratase PrpD
MTATTPDRGVAALTGPLLDWSARVDFDDLPAEVVHAARRAVVDSLGVTLGGSQTEATTILLDLADELSGAPVATVVGHRRRVDVVTATMVNGVSAHVLDFDDTLIPTRIHASAPLLPALLAVGQTRGSTYRDLLAAFVVGFELQARLALAMYPDYADRGWHGTSVVAPMAVATAAGRLLRLDPGRLAHAAGLGVTQGAGITAVFGSMAKSLNLGRAGASGVQGALLAARGFTSNPAALEAGKGFFSRYSSVLDTEALLGDLGTRWAVLEDGFKPYACGLVAHAAIDGVLDLRRRTGFVPDDIEGIHLRVPPESLVLMGNRSPTTELEAKFSVAYAAAAAYLDGSAGPDSFADERVSDPRYRDLLRRVSVEADAAIRQDESVVTLHGRGESHEAHVEHALGTQRHPMTDDDLVAKFTSLAAPVIGDASALDLVQRLWRLDHEPVSDLTTTLQPAEEPAP